MLPPESSRRNSFVLGGRQKRGHAGEAHRQPCLPDRRRRILEPPMGELRLLIRFNGKSCRNTTLRPHMDASKTRTDILSELQNGGRELPDNVGALPCRVLRALAHRPPIRPATDR